MRIIVPHHLRLSIPAVPRSYAGNLYFLLGQGLGDSLNGFRILHEVLGLFPCAHPIVYGDPRWQELYDLLPELQGQRLRWYEVGRTPTSNGQGSVNPYDYAFDEIFAETSREPGLIALGNFNLPDRWAKKEPPIAVAARAIGLSLDQKRCRPYLPIPEACVEKAMAFLKGHGLELGQYVVMAPHTWPDKMWKPAAWERLVTLVEAINIPIVVIGLTGYPSIKGKAISEALGLSLPIVAALIARARCYVGLDSGPTHLAAVFDVPIVTLNPQGKFPPFLVEPGSPFKWTHVTPRVYGHGIISPESVFSVVKKALEGRHPTPCPACAALPYVLQAQPPARILYLCRCGLLFREGQEPMEVAPESGSAAAIEIPTELPTTTAALAGVQGILQYAEGHEGLPAGPFVLTFDHYDPVELEPGLLLRDQTGRDLWWTWDAAYQFMARHGWEVLRSLVVPRVSNDAAVCRITMEIAPAGRASGPRKLDIPVGRNIMRVKHTLYERWLAWMAFRKQEDIEGLGWLLVNQGNPSEGLEILRLAWKLHRRWKTFRRLVRASMKALQPT